jgi:hypothetical protein
MTLNSLQLRDVPRLSPSRRGLDSRRWVEDDARVAPEQRTAAARRREIIRIERVRPKLMRGTFLSRGLHRIGAVLPVLLPESVGAIQAQGQHVLGVVEGPPSAGAFEPLLHDVAVGTFDLARADG